MKERLNNDFQFVEVGRVDPKKVPAKKRKKEFGEIYHPFSQEQAAPRRTAVWPAATPTVSGSARCTTTFRTG